MLLSSGLDKFVTSKAAAILRSEGRGLELGYMKMPQISLLLLKFGCFSQLSVPYLWTVEIFWLISRVIQK